MRLVGFPESLSKNSGGHSPAQKGPCSPREQRCSLQSTLFAASLFAAALLQRPPSRLQRRTAAARRRLSLLCRADLFPIRSRSKSRSRFRSLRVPISRCISRSLCERQKVSARTGGAAGRRGSRRDGAGRRRGIDRVAAALCERTAGSAIPLRTAHSLCAPLEHPPQNTRSRTPSASSDAATHFEGGWFKMRKASHSFDWIFTLYFLFPTSSRSIHLILVYTRHRLHSKFLYFLETIQFESVRFSITYLI